MSSFASYPSLKDKSVFVSGGGSGIGAAIVEHFAAQGSKVGFVDIDEAASTALAKKTGAVVASVEYRHAPDFLFPAALGNTFNAYKWTPENAAKFGGDPKRVVIDVAIRPRS